MGMQRDIDKKKIGIAQLDRKMAKKGVGRRRRATKSSPKAKKKARKPIKIPPLKARNVDKKDPFVRRRRTKARLTKEFMKDAAQTSGVGVTKVPAVPKQPKST